MVAGALALPDADFVQRVLDLALGRSGGMGEDGGLVDAINALGQGKVLEALGKLGTDPHLLGLAAWLLAGGMGLYLLYGSFLRAFPEQPLAAVADWAARMRLTEDTAYAGFTDRFRQHFRDVTEALAPRPLVLLLDEVDGLVGEAMVSFLTQLRHGYIERSKVPFPASVVLVGQRQVRDYALREEDRRALAWLGTTSPFNITAESTTLGPFSEAEVGELLAQHTALTGQRFSGEAVRTIWALGCGHPWLTNALADQIVRRDVEDRTEHRGKRVHVVGC